MSPWLIILWAIFSTLQPSASKSGICNTPVCHEVAAQFTASMKTTIDPCVNFYQYACGRWPSAYPKPKYRKLKYWNNEARLASLAETRLRDELQSAVSSSDSQPIRQMKKFYKTCMDETSESDALTRIQRILYETGGWPMVMNSSQWNTDCRRWQAVDEYYAKILGNSAFYAISLAEEHWSDYHPILIQYPLFHADLYEDRAAYRSLIKQVAETFIQQNDAIVSDQQLEDDIDDLMRFEDRLYRASRASNDILKRDDFESFVEEFDKRAGNHLITEIVWKLIFRRLFVLTKTKPTAHAPFGVKSLDYFLKLGRILQTTKKRTIINYIQWESLSKILPHASTKMRDLFYIIQNDVEDIQNTPPRWMHCVNQIGRNYASYSLFIEKYYPENSRQAAENLYRRLRDSWTEQLDNSNWLSRETKNTVKHKIDTLSAVLGYSSFYKDDQKINVYFEGLTIGDSYIENTISFMKYVWEEQLKNWGQPSGSIENLNDPLQQIAEYRQSDDSLCM